MIDSPIFNSEILSLIQNNLCTLLNSCTDFSNPYIVHSPRAVGDAVQELLSHRLDECFPNGLIRDFDGKFARRSMADMAFIDKRDNYIMIDVKTHNRDTVLNMPNLTSVERLSRFYEDDKNYFVVLFAEYSVIDGKAVFDSVKLIPIEHFQWNCLVIGALGWGQIQIANANVITIDRSQSRKSWMLQLCDAMDIFYPKEIMKIEERMGYFARVRSFWQNK